jgi:hypothetical protein
LLRAISSLSYTQNGSINDPSKPHGLSLIHRVPDTPTTRELAVKYNDEKQYFVSESSVYRILKAADLITAPDYVVIKAADEFTDKTTAINEMPLSCM